MKLSSTQVEEVLIPEVRRQRYPALDLATLVLVFERYREQVRRTLKGGRRAVLLQRRRGWGVGRGT